MKIMNNKKGIILLTVIMLVLAMTTLAVGILGAIGSQGLLGQNQVDRIKAEQLAKGYFWKSYMQGTATGTAGTGMSSETINGKFFTIGVSAPNPGTGPSGTNPLQVSVTYQ